MLKFLTHKLRTHSLNEDNVSEKVEERDSGTESDDEAERDGDSCTDVVMKWNDVTDISGCVAGAGAGAGCVCAAPRRPEPDLLYDHHSSEEELEVINGAPTAPAAASESRRRGASSPPPGPAAPEKRKWPAEPYHDAEDAARPASDDDEDTKVETPVRFRTSPPLEALKPRRSGAGADCPCAVVVTSPAPTGVGASSGSGTVSSPRRRRAYPAPPPPRRHRPALDFDKMQQLKVGGSGGVGGVGSAGVRSWRGVGGAGGELSVFCW